MNCSSYHEHFQTHHFEMEETDVKGEENVQEHIADGASLPSSTSWVPSPLSTVSSPYSQNVLPSRLAWSPSGDLLAVASDDARVRLFPVTDNLTFGAQTLMKEGEVASNLSCT